MSNNYFNDPLTTIFDSHQIDENFNLLFNKDIPDSTKKIFLQHLHQRGETAEELAYIAQYMLSHALPFPEIIRTNNKEFLDICGTGGDKSNLINISTVAMFIAVGAGVSIIKHGNYGITSSCGSANILEKLGISTLIPLSLMNKMFAETGLLFLFAPIFHPLMKSIHHIRQELALSGQLTVFNLLGPLINPSQPKKQLVGIYQKALLEKYATTLKILGREKAWIVHGQGDSNIGIDELSTLGESHIIELSNMTINKIILFPEDWGIKRAITLKSAVGKSINENAQRIHSILKGEEKESETVDIILLNAAAAIRISRTFIDYHDAYLLAKESLLSGKAYQILEKLRKINPLNS